MERKATVARALHDIGLAAWFGGSLMGAVGLNGASHEVRDPTQRSRVANSGWARWTPANLAAIGAYLVGGSIMTSKNRRRLFAQKGVGQATVAKTALTGVTLAATAYSRILGERMMKAGDVPVEDAVHPAPETPENIAKIQRQLRLLEWAIPAHVAGLIALNAKMGEQQRPGQVLKGITKQLGSEKGRKRALASIGSPKQQAGMLGMLKRMGNGERKAA